MDKTFSNRNKIKTAMIFLILASLACASPLGGSSGGESATPIPSPTTAVDFSATATAQAHAVETLAAGGTLTELTATPRPDTSTAGTAPTIVYGAECVIGRWSMDIANAHAFLSQTLAGHGVIDVSVLSVSGTALLEFTTANVAAGSSSGAQIDFSVNGVTLNTVTNGTVSGTFSVDAEELYLANLSYNIVGQLSEPVHITDVNAESFMDFVKSIGFAPTFDGLPTDLYLPYTCVADQLVVEINVFSPLVLTRQR